MDGFEHLLDLLARGWSSLAQPGPQGVGLWLLAATFCWSGVFKLRHSAVASLALVDFGVTTRADPRAGRALGSAELALAATLAAAAVGLVALRPATAPVAIVLWCFVALIAWSLAAGRRFSCFCFGDAEISWVTFGRALCLALLATALAAAQAGRQGAPSLQESGLEALVAVSALNVVAVMAALWRLFRVRAEAAAQLEAGA